MTPADLRALRALADAATPGARTATAHGIDAADYAEVIGPGPVSCMAYCYGGSSTITGDRLAADLAFIAACDPDTVRALIAAAERLERIRTLFDTRHDDAHDALLVTMAQEAARFDDDYARGKVAREWDFGMVEAVVTPLIHSIAPPYDDLGEPQSLDPR